MVEIRQQCGQERAVWLWNRMSRMKKLSPNLMETPLKRCLTTFDITLLGIGHMVGAGIYVLVGTVAKDTAGPGIVLSFLIAGIVSILSSLCYAEFGARVPKAGSAYIYTYVSIGEFWAFVIGWNIILEHMIGAASVARAWSGYVDSLFDGAISNTTVAAVGEMHETFLAPYPDPLAFFVTLIYCALLTVGVKGSAYINSIFTLLNMFVIVFVIAVGLFCADFANWQSTGFLPFGFSGVLAGAATSFYAFVGFDSIATSSEEAVDPTRSIPLATMMSMTIVTAGYVLVGATLTLMVPYYDLNPAAAIPDAFAANGVIWAKYVVSIGALCGMTTTLFGSLFSLPRCVYAMASDGLLFEFLGKVSEKTQLPVLNMILCGSLSAFIALIFDIEKLVEFMSIGTLMAYTIVSASVVILRYRPKYIQSIIETEIEIPPTPMEEECKQTMVDDPDTCDLKPSFYWIGQYINPRSGGKVVTWAVAAFSFCSMVMAALLQWGLDYVRHELATLIVFLLVICSLIMATCVFIIFIHKQIETELSFRVPLVPFIPLLSIFCNISLMAHLNPMTWLRFVIWMAIGLLVYFMYGVHHSKEAEHVSSYSTLLTNPAPASDTVFGTVQQKLSQVTSKILSTTGKSSSDQTGLMKSSSKDKQPIIDREEEIVY